MNDFELFKTWNYNKENIVGSYYNFNITPLINDFSFLDFITMCKPHSGDHGGFVVITDNQYIIGYNSEFGSGTHAASFARVMKEIKGGGPITTIQDAHKLSSDCQKNFITASIDYEDTYVDDGLLNVTKSGSIHFSLPGDRKTINPKQFEVFKKFYDDYNLELSILIRKYGITKFHVSFTYVEDDKKKKIVSENLDDLYEYLESHIDLNKETESVNNEKIIGIKPKKDQKVKTIKNI